MTTVYVDSKSFTLKFCADVTGKPMKLVCLENISPASAVIYVDQTPLRYGLLKNERRHCLMTEDDQFVAMFRSARCEKRKAIVQDPRDMQNLNILHDGKFLFTRDGCLLISGYPVRYSEYGYPFVYAFKDIAVDARGNLFSEREGDGAVWYSADYEEPYPQEPQYIFALGRELGLTSDRRVIYRGEYITGILDPVVDLCQTRYGIWCLTSTGEVYYLEKENGTQAVRIASEAAAIADTCNDTYFVYSDKRGKVYVYDWILKEEASEPEKIFDPGRGRLSELAVWENRLVFKCVNCGSGAISLLDGKAIR